MVVCNLQASIVSRHDGNTTAHWQKIDSDCEMRFTPFNIVKSLYNSFKTSTFLIIPVVYIHIHRKKEERGM